MITCPNCKKTLPDWAQNCQFCGSDLKSVARPFLAPVQGRARGSARTADWIWPAYYGICGWDILNGIYGIIMGLQPHRAHGLMPATSSNPFLIFFGVFEIIWGLALAAKIEIVRGITNILCFLSIAAGVLQLVGYALSTALVPFFGGALVVVAAIFMTVFNIACSGLMIYLLGETD